MLNITKYWREINDENIMKICNTDEHMTMQEIADVIANLLKDCGKDIVCTSTYNENGTLFYIHLNGM